MTQAIYTRIARLLGYKSIEEALVDNIDLFDESEKEFIRNLNSE